MLFELVQPHKILDYRDLGNGIFVLSMERRNLRVRAGRHVGVGLNHDEVRQYSVYSGEADEVLEILVRKVDGGRVSPALSFMRPGDRVHVKPPRGSFTLSKAQPDEHLVLMATGTGIAPFRSFLRTVPDLNCTVVHGVRTEDENFGEEFVPLARFILCVSRPLKPLNGDSPHLFHGRVTDWLKSVELRENNRYFLCGNSSMTTEATDFLMSRGVPPEKIHNELYF